MQDQFELSSLTQKELLILALWACAKTVKESARHLKISDRTINYYRGRLRCMLNARSSNEVITKLIMMEEYELLISLGKMYLTTPDNIIHPLFPVPACG